MATAPSRVGRTTSGGASGLGGRSEAATFSTSSGVGRATIVGPRPPVTTSATRPRTSPSRTTRPRSRRAGRSLSPRRLGSFHVEPSKGSDIGHEGAPERDAAQDPEGLPLRRRRLRPPFPHISPDGHAGPTRRGRRRARHRCLRARGASSAELPALVPPREGLHAPPRRDRRVPSRPPLGGVRGADLPRPRALPPDLPGSPPARPRRGAPVRLLPDLLVPGRHPRGLHAPRLLPDRDPLRASALVARASGPVALRRGGPLRLRGEPPPGGPL